MPEMGRVEELRERYPNLRADWETICEILLKLRVAGCDGMSGEDEVWDEFDRRFDRERRRRDDPYHFDYLIHDGEEIDFVWWLEVDKVRTNPELQRYLDRWDGKILLDDGFFMVECTRDEKRKASDFLDNMGVNDEEAFMMMMDEVMPIHAPEPASVSSEDFPTRFGVEMEFESEEFNENSWIYSRLTSAGLDVKNVSYDGSLETEGGFEVISQPLSCLRETYEFMRDTKRELEGLGIPIKSWSPTAIHVHVSNIKNPTNLFLIMSAMG